MQQGWRSCVSGKVASALAASTDADPPLLNEFPESPLHGAALRFGGAGTDKVAHRKTVRAIDEKCHDRGQVGLSQ
jgi:hypothetical protein